MASENDPRKLIPALESFSAEIRRNAQTHKIVCKEAETTLRHVREHSRRLRQRTSVAADAASAAQRETANVGGRLSAAGSAADGVATEARLAAESAHKTVLQAADYRKRWKVELNLAEDELHRAELELAAALSEQRDAESALQRARARLDSANSELASCRARTEYDGDGNPIEPDCSGSEQEVRLAQQQVADAEARLQRAIQRVAAARQMVASAQARVQRAENGFNKCDHALQCAQEAEANASVAQTAAARSQQCVDSADKALQSKKNLLAEMNKQVKQMRLCAERMSAKADAAQSRFFQARQWLEKTSLDALTSNRDLKDQVEELRRYNRTEGLS